MTESRHFASRRGNNHGDKSLIDSKVRGFCSGFAVRLSTREIPLAIANCP
ncbi:hypothetical protein B6N60_01764 [Richelia sinica FACHB-800]|uniref:Uncharacterized protein n=1 Tax=Richelia sinica FACHB-800 TaxID=1357546 RepID=A0A975T702_9NOST|nr:hypothetical protein [Richelia sinica]MBD2666087.1 hypothetical protein [Richelia sinica FACHB-800]QXE23075.1 hypothetical protein B6N60_01764 [Richelia sinica FACHB-800]